MPSPGVTIQFDWTITIGSLLTALTVVISIVSAIVKYYHKIDDCIHRIEAKADTMHAENKMTIAVIESRVTDMWERFIEQRMR